MKKGKESDMGLLKAEPVPETVFEPLPEKKKRKFNPPFRMSGMTALTLVLVVAIYFMARQQIGILVFKYCLITGAAVIGYAIDRTMFPGSRPHCVGMDDRWRYEMRRAVIVAAAMLTAGLGS